MTPFANETEAEQIGGLTVENRVKRLAIFGEIDITKDRAGRSSPSTSDPAERRREPA